MIFKAKHVDIADILHTVREIQRSLPRDASAYDVANALGAAENGRAPASISVAIELLSLVQAGAVTDAVLDRLAHSLTVGALQQLAKTIRKEFEAREAERREIEAEQSL